MGREELKSRLSLSSSAFNALVRRLAQQSRLVESGPLLHLPAHQVLLTARQQETVDGLMAQFSASPLAPPSVKDCVHAVGEDVYRVLIDMEQLRQVSAEVVFRVEDYEYMLHEVRDMIEINHSVTVAQARDKLNTTRKYVLALLEYMDAQGITVRHGDERHLRKGA